MSIDGQGRSSVKRRRRRLESRPYPVLEREASAEADGALAAGRAADLAERVAGRGAEAGVRVAPAHRVRDVERVDAELRVLRRADLEALEERAVELPEARALGTRVAA